MPRSYGALGFECTNQVPSYSVAFDSIGLPDGRGNGSTRNQTYTAIGIECSHQMTVDIDYES